MIVHRSVDLYFQGHTISKNISLYNIWKTVSASEKCSSTTFIEVSISHRMAPLRVFYIVTLTYIFNVTKFRKIHK